MSEEKSFFTTLPGILTELATFITAVVGLVYALNKVGMIGVDVKDETDTASVSPVPPVKEAPQRITPAAPESPRTQNTVSPVQPAVETHRRVTRTVPEPPREQTTDGWTIIGYYERGTFSDLALMVHADAPAIGRSYKAVKDFRLVQKQRLEPGEATITLGMVDSGDIVEVLDIKIEPGTRRVPVYAKLRAVLHPIHTPGR